MKGVVGIYGEYGAGNRFRVGDKKKELILDNKLYKYLYKNKRNRKLLPLMSLNTMQDADVRLRGVLHFSIPELNFRSADGWCLRLSPHGAVRWAAPFGTSRAVMGNTPTSSRVLGRHVAQVLWIAPCGPSQAVARGRRAHSSVSSPQPKPTPSARTRRRCT